MEEENMEPKRNAPKFVAIICVVALLVAIYCSCFVAETAGGQPLIHYPYGSDSSETLPKTSFEPGTPDVPPELPAPPAPPESTDSGEASGAISTQTIPTDSDIIWLGDSTIRLQQEEAVEPSVKSLLSQANCYLWDDEEVIDYFDEVTPSLEYTCPYDIHKCVQNITYVHGGLTITWDIYLFSYDGLIGTWIVNDSGKDIVFYGDAYLYEIDNYNVHLGKLYHTDYGNSVVVKHLCVYPQSFTDGFMIVTYSEEIDKIS